MANGTWKMENKIVSICSRAIEYSFYLIFLIVPWVMSGTTFELFEFNKMWLTFALTLLILAAWLIKMVAQRRIIIQRTPLDIPIILFLLSQIIATFHSLDTHVSIWGFYSRFNGGLLSIISYIFLYYAFVSNLFFKHIAVNVLKISLISGLVVALWGLPSHFGYDPTCLMLRGSLDVSCWTEAFQPRVRIFSTLGQPNWLAAYLSILIPVALAFGIENSKHQAPNPKQIQNSKSTNSKRFENLNFKNWNLFSIWNLGFVILFYTTLLYTSSRSGFLGLWVGLAFFIAIYIWQTRLINKYKILNTKYLILLFVILGSITFVVGSPFEQLKPFTLDGLRSKLKPETYNLPFDFAQGKQPIEKPQGPALETGGTESGEIRKMVWQGAADIAKHNPLFGSGVETFAFAYYQYRPANHNLTSEWDYLYNKAHNEYLNYLATTGVFGLGSYLIMIITFIIFILKKRGVNSFLVTGLLAGYISILVINFFGFSVVIVNLYFFLIPAFVFVLNGQLNPQHALVFPNDKSRNARLPAGQENSMKNARPERSRRVNWKLKILIILILFAILYLQFTLLRFWLADKAFALGYNLDRTGQYQEAYPKLQEAVQMRGDEPTFADEFSINSAILAAALINQTDPTIASQAAEQSLLLAQQAIAISDDIVSKHPNNVVFWKTRVRMFYALSQINPKYLAADLDAVKKASLLAPTDAKIFYNLGLLYGQNGKGKEALEALEKAVKLKPDYRDAYYALGLFYHDLAIDKARNVVKPELEQKAIDSLQYILNNISTTDAQAKQKLLEWRGY